MSFLSSSANTISLNTTIIDHNDNWTFTELEQLVTYNKQIKKQPKSNFRHIIAMPFRKEEFITSKLNSVEFAQFEAKYNEYWSVGGSRKAMMRKMGF